MMQSKLAHIDSLRGIAILMVILVHTAQSVPDLPKWFFKITKAGQLGVQLFFVVSAITLCISMEQRWNEKYRTIKYLLRRFFRIAPLYYTGILFYFLFSALVNSSPVNLNRESFINILANFFFLHGFYPPANNSVVPGGWSIGTEMAFYLCFPILFTFWNWIGRQGIAKFLTITLFWICGYYLIEFFLTNWLGMPVQKNNFMYYNLINQLPVFVMGIAAYQLTKSRGFSNLHPALHLLGLAFFGSLTAYLWNIDLTFVNSFMLLPGAAGLAFVFLYNLFASLRFLNLSGLQKTGQVSYSMYIFHFIFAWYGTEYLHAQLGYFHRPLVLFALYFALTVSLTFGLALVSEKLIERPGVELGKKIIQGMS